MNLFFLYLRLTVAFWVFGAGSLFAQSPGDLDSTFGNGGMVRTTLSPNGTPSNGNSLLQPDGKIISSIFFEVPNQPQTLLARHLPDGSLDPSWGQNGIVTNTVLGATQLVVPNDLYLSPDNKLLVLGYRDTSAGQLPSGFYCCHRPFIFKYNSDGSLDSSFGNNGMALPWAVKMEKPWALTISNNRIITSGATVDVEPDSVGIFLSAYNLQDGSIDTSWGNQGHYFIPIFNSSQQKIITQPDQKILLTLSGGYVYRFTANGQLDSSFGPTQEGFLRAVEATGGGVDNRMPILLQPDNKILISGAASNQSPYVGGSVVERYLPDGTLDSSFAHNGVFPVFFNMPPPLCEYSKIMDMKQQTDGKIVVGGAVTYSSAPSFNQKNSFALARYDSLGNIDSTFGNNGVVLTLFNTGDSIQYTRNIHLQPDGKIIQTGVSTFYNGNFNATPISELNLARFWGDSVLINAQTVVPTPNSRFDFHPNPAKSSIQSLLSIKTSGHTELSIYDLQGRKVQQLLNKEMAEGEHQLTFNLAANLASGVYVLKLQTEKEQYAKMLVIE